MSGCHLPREPCGVGAGTSLSPGEALSGTGTWTPARGDRSRPRCCGGTAMPMAAAAARSSTAALAPATHTTFAFRGGVCLSLQITRRTEPEGAQSTDFVLKSCSGGGSLSALTNQLGATTHADPLECEIRTCLHKFTFVSNFFAYKPCCSQRVRPCQLHFISHLFKIDG